MKTVLMLMTRYDALPVISIETVCRDFFDGMLPAVFLRKVLHDEIGLPIVRLGDGQRAAKGVAIEDLAAFIDKAKDDARREREQLKQSA